MNIENLKSFSKTDYILTLMSPAGISSGATPGISHVNKFGKNPDVSTTVEAVWNGGGDYTGFDPVAAETLDVVSGDIADDIASGEGAWTVEVFGLDADYLPISETVELDGTVAVTTTASFIRMNRAIVRTAGTLGHNVGAITASQSVSGDVMMVMPALYNQTMIAAYTIPANTTGLLSSWFGAIAKKQAAYADIQLVARPFGETFQVKEELTLSSSGSSYIHRFYNPCKGPFAAKTDIKVLTVADSAANGISAGFDFILIDLT